MISSGTSSDSILRSENPSDEHLWTLLLLWTYHKKQLLLEAPQLDFRYKTEARKVIVDFKFDALFR